VIDRATNELRWTPHASAVTGDSAVVTVVATHSGGAVLSRQFKVTLNSADGVSEILAYVEPPEEATRSEAASSGDDDDFDFAGDGDSKGSKSGPNAAAIVAPIVVVLLVAIGAAAFFQVRKSTGPVADKKGPTYTEEGHSPRDIILVNGATA
jgi:hypothetical protein